MTTKDILKDPVHHGDALFPLRVWTHEFEEYGQLCKYHWHTELEFICVLKGSCVFQVETAFVEIQAGQALFINSGVLHSDYALQYPYASFSIVFDPSMLSSPLPDACFAKYLGPLIQNPHTPFILIQGEAKWESSILKSLHRVASIGTQNTPGYELHIKSSLYSIFGELASCGKLGQKTDRQNTHHQDKIDKLKDVLTFIQKNYQRKIYVQDMADCLNMSQYHFMRFFKEFTGKTPIEYLNQYRVSEAVKRLQESDQKILDISLEVGFENLSYFIKTFKKHMKYTPGEFQEKFGTARSTDLSF